MGKESKIEWTDATWNPMRGCDKVSAGCTNCYAETLMERFRGGSYVNKEGERVPHAFVDGFDFKIVPEMLDAPLRWRRGRRIFVNSLSDVFHPGAPFQYIAAVFGVMAAAKQHTFQVLTKRPARMVAFFKWLDEQAKKPRAPTGGSWNITCANDSRHVEEVGFAAAEHDNCAARMPDVVRAPWPLPNVWIGVSVENQKAADERIELLRMVPAAVRFLSCEPLVGPVVIGPGLPSPDWVIVGGESGPKARPMDPEWARGIRDQCVAAGVPFHFKQWGEWAPDASGNLAGRYAHEGRVKRIGKKAAGRVLDGRTWDQFPE